MTPKELEERLINFAVSVIKIADGLKNSRAGNNMANQIVKSGTSPALNYGEAQSGESVNDFKHKIQIVLKELRETMVSLKIIKSAGLHEDLAFIEDVLQENNELISIFVSTINTLKKNNP